MLTFEHLVNLIRLKFAHKMMNTPGTFIYKVFRSNIDSSVLFHEIDNFMFDKYGVRDFLNNDIDALCSRIFYVHNEYNNYLFWGFILYVTVYIYKLCNSFYEINIYYHYYYY